jgi:hypothetical protein
MDFMLAKPESFYRTWIDTGDSLGIDINFTPRIAEAAGEVYFLFVFRHTKWLDVTLC